jgi:thimet oligopeptidase
VKGTHFQSSFSHLIGYDAGYYGYQWALSLAYDVLSRFRHKGTTVLERGGSRDERELIQGFLGRPPSEAAYVAFLKGE